MKINRNKDSHDLSSKLAIIQINLSYSSFISTVFAINLRTFIYKDRIHKLFFFKLPINSTIDPVYV